MKSYADLEISLHRFDAQSYAVEFRYSQAGTVTLWTWIWRPGKRAPANWPVGT